VTASHAPIIVTVRCHYCSRGRSLHELHPIGTGGVLICDRCIDWHERAMGMLTRNEMPDGCQECGIPLSTLQAIHPGGNIPMSLVVKDGIYQILCRPCTDEYVRKRRDLYGPTQFGREKGIA
jgi:hypothetical protein